MGGNALLLFLSKKHFLFVPDLMMTITWPGLGLVMAVAMMGGGRTAAVAGSHHPMSQVNTCHEYHDTANCSHSPSMEKHALGTSTCLSVCQYSVSHLVEETRKLFNVGTGRISGGESRFVAGQLGLARPIHFLDIRWIGF